MHRSSMESTDYGGAGACRSPCFIVVFLKDDKVRVNEVIEPVQTVAKRTCTICEAKILSPTLWARHVIFYRASSHTRHYDTDL